MPRKTKEQKELENEEKSTKKVAATKATKSTKAKSSSSKASSKTTKTTAAKKTSTKKAATKVEPAKKTTTKKAATKAEPAKKTTTKKAATKTEPAKKTTTKKATTKNAATKKATTKKATTKTAATKKTNTKKSTAKKTATKKTTSRKTATKAKSTKKVEVVEYYDLPYRYNQTVVKILAQTPTNLFIYWDVADSDRENFEKQYGENFFETTRPILIVHNETLGYSFEVEINDFANSWYLHVADSKCDYKIELGRRPIVKTEKLENTDYIYIATSNQIESPNDKVLIDQLKSMLLFRNIKTGEEYTKSINTLSFIRNMERIYNIYDLYRALYNEEDLDEIYDLSNPSSRNPSSNTFSSRFRK